MVHKLSKYDIAANKYLPNIFDKISSDRNIRPVMPRHQRVAAGLKTSHASSWPERTKYVIANGRDYISYNSPYENLIRFIIVDVDHDDDTLPGGMPLPMCTIYSPDTLRHHHIWQLAAPVAKGSNAMARPQALLRAVTDAVTEVLGGDPAFTGALAKSAWSDRWTVQWHDTRPVKLHDFDAWLPEDQKPVWRKGRRREVPNEFVGRNHEVFDRTRFWCYQTGTTDGAQIAAKADEINAALDTPMCHKEVMTIAKSITKFMNTRWVGGQKAVGVMAANFAPSMSTRDRQCAAAYRTAKNKRNNTRGRVTAYATGARLGAALMYAREDLPALNISRLARRMGRTRKTIAGHLKNVDLPF